MKKLLFSTLITLSFVNVYSQSSSGLIAHWDMNGSANDVSGNGHNGTCNNVTPVAGRSGVPNTAYYFNGVNSVITAPYLPDLNLNKFTLCATVSVSGFYTGLCQSNVIVTRGATSDAGNYAMLFDDNAYDGDNCNALDTTKDIFYAMTRYNFPGTPSAWLYSPYISENIWYKIVITYDSVMWKIYVDGALKNTIIGNSIPMGTSTDSLAIGMDIFEAAAGYPYNFKGIIDDIEIYGRVLTDSEIISYGDTCGRVLVQPVAEAIGFGKNAMFTVGTSISSPVYQWQQDAGLGFVDLTNSGPYSGVYTDTLTISGVTALVNSDHYRCVVSNSSGCVDTSLSSLLTATGVNTVTLKDRLSIYPNPTQNLLEVHLTGNDYQGSIQLLNQLGNIISDQNILGDITSIDLKMVQPGIYFLRVENGSEVVYKKILKD